MIEITASDIFWIGAKDRIAVGLVIIDDFDLLRIGFSHKEEGKTNQENEQ